MTPQQPAAADDAAPGGEPRGVIHQISVSAGGVPKQAVAAAEVTPLGLTGDRQHNTWVHGGSRRAVCLYSLDVIACLRAEGHPIALGSTGENVTVSGLDWTRVQPGVRLRLGAEVLLEITDFTVPCSTIKDSFADGNAFRIAQQRAPGQSRVYARVLSPGRIQVGDGVELVGGGG
jgi:MOSC domain-containing protein YiiM